MEPVAPGTEDEVIHLSQLNKQETETDRLLSKKIRLKNGKLSHVFELSYVSGSEHWFCKVCECPIMGRVYQHEIGRRHTTNMEHHERRPSNSKKEEEENPRGQKQDDQVRIMEVAPGEPLPPGFEGDVQRRAIIQDRLDGFKVGPLVALEYLIEMHDDSNQEPLYLCILCDKKGDPRTVLTHLASYNHISQFLQKHFPTCYRALAPYMTKQYKRNWQITLQKIAEAIEKKYGRLKPFCMDKDKFEADRLTYLNLINKGRHYSESNGVTFTELVIHDELTKTYDDGIREPLDVKREASNTERTVNGKLIHTEKGEPKPQPHSWGGKASIEKPFHKRSPSPPVVARPSKRNKPSPKVQGGRRRSLSSVSSLSSDDEKRGGRRDNRKGSPRKRDRNYRRRSPTPPRRRPSPRNEKYKVPSREEELKKLREKQEKISEYNRLCKAIDNDLDRIKKNNEKNPEKHAKYNDEWKKFWNRRYKELQAEGKDPSKHDFKPEWILFWGKKMTELHQEEMKNRKDGLRRRLGLEPEDLLPIDLTQPSTPAVVKVGNKSEHFPVKQTPKMPMASRPDNDPEVTSFDNKKLERNDRNSRDARDGNARNSRDTRDGNDRNSRDSRDVKRRSPGRNRSPERKQLSPLRRAGEKKLDWKSPERNISPKRRSLERLRLSPARLRISPNHKSSPARGGLRISPARKSTERSLRISPARRSSQERFDRRSPFKERVLSPSRSRMSPRRSADREKSRGRRSRSREMLDRERELLMRDRERRGYSREESYERDRFRRDRETSYERDMRGRDRIRTIADLPWEREKMMFGRGPGPMPYDNFYQPPPPGMYPMGGPMGGPMGPRPPMMGPPGMHREQPPPEEEEDDGQVNIVSVLRLLTALEERMGSLGPKVIDLLAQALALEKKEPNSSEKLLDNEINCVLFETVKEKLKGQLLAGLVEPIQERAYKKAIQKSANIVHIAEQRKRQRLQFQPPEKAPVVVPGVGQVDKAAIARQVANALVAQGKTDVTQQELEQLINAVVGMAEASRKTSQPVTTATFLSKLAAGGGITEAPRPRTPEQEKLIFTKPARLEDLGAEPLSPSTPEKTQNNMENLSDSDLQTLLQNFKDLSTEEQMNLINYLKKLEFEEPDRVERLRKFVNLGPSTKPDAKEEEEREKSPLSKRLDKRNEDKKVIHLDSEDEDYSYEDVVKTVSKNVQQKEMDQKMKVVEDSISFDSSRKEDTSLTDAKALISNLMGSITKAAKGGGVDLLGLGLNPSNNDVTRSLSNLGNINLESLGSILSNVQNLTSQLVKKDENKAGEGISIQNKSELEKAASKLNFEPPMRNESPERSNNGQANMSSRDEFMEIGSSSLGSYGGRMPQPGPGFGAARNFPRGPRPPFVGAFPPRGPRPGATGPFSRW